MAEKKIAYTERDFLGLRNELLRYTNDYYPDLIQNANDASLFSVFLDLNAAVADNLHYHIDRSMQETVLQYAQERSSLYNIARTYGLKIPGNRPSVSVVDFSINVPVRGDKEDARYLGILQRGAQCKGAGQVFETANDVNFASPYDASGFPNRTKIPNFDSNGNIVDYTITKREVVVNGITKVFKRVITDSDVKPFLKVYLPERNVLGVVSVIQKDGNNVQALPNTSEFISSPNKWYQVDALVDDKVFIVDSTKPTGKAGIKVGKHITTDNRYITEYTPEGFFYLTFGGGLSSNQSTLDDFVTQTGYNLDLNKYMDNISLGLAPKANTTLFIQYRVGGGKNTNLGNNVINVLGLYNFALNGPNNNINNSVDNSLKVTNITAAIGGANMPSIEEVRNYVSFNFAAQNRAVTINDYIAQIRKMPSEFGAPAKVGVVEEENKVLVKLLSYTPEGALTSRVPSILSQNVADYMSDYRMLNDYISVGSAEVIDLRLEIYLYTDKGFNQGQIVTNVINTTAEFFQPTKRELGQDVFLGELSKELAQLDGVINIIDIELYNELGGQYSDSQVSQPYSNSVTRQISLIDQTIFAQPNQTFQVRYPDKDIVVRLKNPDQTNIS
jgi:hypothetical protein